ncbi:hypothetical protein OPV22_017204 [Ensete ventricosum]|uniref:Uncharacterized protein n=1 Tax=Ensete ventricosum TaxID=4639 RepID=A0AAV8QMT9_ENSVE|nr:hypothetical protein OPV22_017204 [Ensete ventricosum]
MGPISDGRDRDEAVRSPTPEPKWVMRPHRSRLLGFLCFFFRTSHRFGCSKPVIFRHVVPWKLQFREAASIPFTKQERYVKVLESLGIKCQCCDGDDGECSSSWDTTCSKLDCHNMRF